MSWSSNNDDDSPWGKKGKDKESSYNGSGGNHGAGAGGGQGSAIRKAGGVSFTLNNNGSIVGDTNQTGVS